MVDGQPPKLPSHRNTWLGLVSSILETQIVCNASHAVELFGTGIAGIMSSPSINVIFRIASRSCFTLFIIIYMTQLIYRLQLVFYEIG